MTFHVASNEERSENGFGIPDETWVEIGRRLSAFDRFRFSIASPTLRRCWLPPWHALLYNFQRAHVARMFDCLTKERSAVDVSLMGRGKSYTTCALARDLGLDLAVVSPNVAKSHWRTVWPEFGFKETPHPEPEKRATKRRKKTVEFDWDEDVETTSPPGAWVLNYERLAVGGWGRVTRVESAKPEFRPTPEWAGEVARGVLLVFDESQFLKTSGRVRTEAALALSEQVYSSNGRSRVLNLSGTPMDNTEEQSPLLARLLGLYRSPLTRVDALAGRVAEGFDEFLRSAGVDDAERLTLVEGAVRGRIDVEKQVETILLDRVAKRRFFTMPPPDIPHRFDVANEFCVLSENGQQKVAQGVQRLRTALSVLSSLDRHDHAGIGRAFNMIRGAQRLIESGKVEALIRRAREVLRKDSTAKVVLAFQTVDAIQRSAAALRDVSPMTFYGATREAERKKILNDFQSRSLDRRVLICNQSMCACGIPLHDVHGDRPRTLFAVPNFQFLNMHQLSFRVFRVGCKSDATVRWVYAQGDGLVEKELLRNIGRKCQDLQKCFGFAPGVLEERSRTPLPNAYPNVFELG